MYIAAYSSLEFNVLLYNVHILYDILEYFWLYVWELLCTE